MSLSANLGFLWTELALPDAIRSAARAGFEAVECHFPYAVDPADVNAALAETALPMVVLNTRPGDPATGESGLAALPGRETDARAAIDEAVDYAAAINCANVHVMAGKAQGPDARAAYIENLTYAAERAGAADLGVLIEPINQRDMPGYFLSDIETAVEIAVEITTAITGDGPASPTAAGHVRVMFDCYHVQISQGDLVRRFAAACDHIGHVQFAGVPSRQEPDRGELNYPWLFHQFREAGYSGHFGAEYRPVTNTAAGLDWMADHR